MDRCENCGAIQDDSREYCFACGSRNAQTIQSSNKFVAAILALILGGLGVHKFYLGNATTGFLFLSATVLSALLFPPFILIPGTIAFIEFVLYLFISEEEFSKRYADGSILGIDTP